MFCKIYEVFHLIISFTTASHFFTEQITVMKGVAHLLFFIEFFKPTEAIEMHIKSNDFVCVLELVRLTVCFGQRVNSIFFMPANLPQMTFICT